MKLCSSKPLLRQVPAHRPRALAPLPLAHPATPLGRVVELPIAAVPRDRPRDPDAIMALRQAKVKKYLEAGWKSDVDMKGGWNIMTVLMAVGLATPLLGLAFAMATYGTLWGVMTPMV